MQPTWTFRIQAARVHLRKDVTSPFPIVLAREGDDHTGVVMDLGASRSLPELIGTCHKNALFIRKSGRNSKT